jgi:hypothetical protein
MSRDARGRVIWNRGDSPSEHVAQELGLEHFQVRSAIHTIKAKTNLRGPDRVTIYENGDVTDERGEDIGNIFYDK